MANMRTINAYRRTTPTYVYNINDAETAGLDLDNFEIGMVLKFGTFTAYVLPVIDGTIFAPVTESSTKKLYVDSRYAWHTPDTNTFHIRVPLWRLPSTVEDEGSFQVFLFNNSSYSNYASDDDGTVVPGQIQAVTMVIDGGSYVLNDNDMPPMLGEATGAKAPNVISTDNPALEIF